MADDDRARRAAARAGWPVRRYQLGQEPADDLSRTTTPEQRLAMMWELAVRAWAISGQQMPSYPRHEIPGRVLRLTG